MKWKLVFLAFCIFSAASRHEAQAQLFVGAKAGIVQYAHGKTYIDDKPFSLSRGDHIQIENGQILRTENGLAEIVLSSNAILRMNENSALRIIKNDFRDVQLELEKGIASIEIFMLIDKPYPFTVKIPNGLLRFLKPGMYRISSDSRTLWTYEGAAIAIAQQNEVKVKKGKMVRFDSGLNPARFETKNADLFYLWAVARSYHRVFLLEKIASGSKRNGDGSLVQGSALSQTTFETSSPMPSESGLSQAINDARGQYPAAQAPTAPAAPTK